MPALCRRPCRVHYWHNTTRLSDCADHFTNRNYCINGYLFHAHGFAGAAAFIEGGLGCLQDAVSVLKQKAAVPRQEEVAVLGVPAAALAHKKASLPGVRVVVAAIVGPIISPAHNDTRKGEYKGPSVYVKMFHRYTMKLLEQRLIVCQ